MAAMTDAELARTMRHFWNEKGDLESCTAFSRSEMEARLPKVLAAWAVVERAQRDLSAELDAAVAQAESQEVRDDQ